MAIWRKGVAPLICCIMFLIIFILLKNSWIIVREIAPGPEYGLLLFLIPGVVTSLISRDTGILSFMIGGLVSILVWFLFRMAIYPRVGPFVPEMTS